MRIRYILPFVVSLTALAGELPRIEFVSRKGLTAQLKVTNAGNEKKFLSPYFLIEEFYEAPAVEGGVHGWVATRPRALAEDVSLEPGGSFEFESPTSFRPTRITVFLAPAPNATKSEYLPVKIELPAVKEVSAVPARLSTHKVALVELSKEEKRKKIIENLRLISAAGEQCLLRHGIQSADIATISRDFPDEIKRILVPIDGEDYSSLIYTSDATLSVESKTLGSIRYPENEK